MTPRETLAASAAAVLAIPDDQGKPLFRGRWGWFGNTKHGGYNLATQQRGRWFILGFQRKGMRGAQPTFAVRRDGWSVLTKADEIARYEVCRDATSADDPRLYRHDVIGFRSPMADLLAAADAETIAETCAAADAGDAMREQITALLTNLESEYLRYLSALSASPGADADYYQWQGHAERLRTTMVALNSVLGRPDPGYRTKEWRAAYGAVAS